MTDHHYITIIYDEGLECSLVGFFLTFNIRTCYLQQQQYIFTVLKRGKLRSNNKKNYNDDDMITKRS